MTMMVNRRWMWCIKARAIVIGAITAFCSLNTPQSALLTAAQEAPPAATVSGWQVYTNTFVGYQFEYPSSWVDNSASYNSLRETEVASCPTNTCDDVQTLMVQMGNTEYIPDPVSDHWTRSKVSVAGTEADRISTPQGLDDVWVQHDGNWFDLQFFYGTDKSKKQLGDSIFNHILASFRFIAPQPLPTPAEFKLFKKIATWTLDSGTAYLSCNDVCKEEPGLYRVFRMVTEGDNNDVGRPYKAVVQTLVAKGWQKCKTVDDEAGTIGETYIKNGKLLLVGRHHSMGAGNGLGITIATSSSLPQESQPVNNPSVPVTSDWETYTNSDFGLEVRYPPDWKVWWVRVDPLQGANKTLTIRLATKKFGGDGFLVMITPLSIYRLTKGSPSDYSIGSNRTEERKSEGSLFAACDRSITVWTNVGSYQYTFTPETAGLLNKSFQLRDVYQKILSTVRITPVQN